MNVDKVRKLRLKTNTLNAVIKDEVNILLKVYGHYLPEHKRERLEELVVRANEVEDEYNKELYK